MRENRTYGSEGGEAERPSLPLSNPVTVRMDNRRIPAPTAPLLLQRLGDLLRMHFVSLKYLQTRLEKVL